MKHIINSPNIKYTVNPVMGGPVQSEEGVLGGIWGGDIKDFDNSKIFLQSFCKDVFKELPMEYAVEMNRLIDLQMEGSIV